MPPASQLFREACGWRRFESPAKPLCTHAWHFLQEDSPLIISQKKSGTAWRLFGFPLFLQDDQRRRCRKSWEPCGWRMLREPSECECYVHTPVLPLHTFLPGILEVAWDFYDFNQKDAGKKWSWSQERLPVCFLASSTSDTVRKLRLSINL